MDLNKKIIILDDVLSKEECNSAIAMFKIHEKNKSSLISPFRDTITMAINKDSNFLFHLSQKIRNQISFLSTEIDIDWSQIVEWPRGSRQNYHLDKASSNTVFTSITYLCDDFDGGETSFLDDMAVVPKIGRTVYFDGNYYQHGVNTITNGIRYTLPIWYKISV